MFLRDLLLAFRKLSRRPGATALALVSLTLAIGFSTAAFSVVDAYYWRNLPVKDPGSLFYASAIDREGRHDQVSWYEIEAIAQQGGAVIGVAGEHRRGPRVKLPDREDAPITAGVTNNYFDVLGIDAAMGRVFHPNTAAEGQVVLSDRYWRTAFGADLNICGKAITLGSASLTVIGVLPRDFAGFNRGFRVDLFVPEPVMFGSLRFIPSSRRRQSDFQPIIRMKPNAGLDVARRAMNQGLRQVESAGLAPGPARKAEVISFTKPYTKPETNMGDIFPWLAGLVLIIAAANFANLRLVNNLSERRETGIRLALGAGRASLLRQHLTESLAVAGIATLLGLLLADWLIELAPAVLYVGSRSADYFIRLDARVFAFSAGAMLLVAAAGALIPLRDSWKSGVMPALKAAAAPSASRWLAALVILQIALITAFVDSAGLLWRSRQNVAAIRPAMDPDRRLLLVEGSFDARGPKLATDAEAMARELSTLPGVVRAAWCRRVMMAGYGGGQRVPFEQPGQPTLTFGLNNVSPNYFAATGARVLAGRPFSEADGPESTLVIMVSQAFERKFFPRGDAVNSWARIAGKDRQIVGVVEDGPSHSLKEDIEPFVYFPFAQRPSEDAAILLETGLDPGRLIAPARQLIRSSGVEFSPAEFKTLAQHLRAERKDEELAANVSAGLALLGIALAAAGLFGVTICAVSRRAREFGVRVAMGATPVVLGRQVIREGLRMALAGVVLGAALCFAAIRLLQTRLYGVEARNPYIFAAAAAAVTLVALLAVLIPARRAARSDPMAALRVE